MCVFYSKGMMGIYAYRTCLYVLCMQYDGICSCLYHLNLDDIMLTDMLHMQYAVERIGMVIIQIISSI